MGDKILSKNFILLSCINFFIAMAFMMLLPILPVFATEVVGLAEGKVGFVVGAFSITAILSRPFVGYALDNYKGTFILSCALVLFVFALGAHMLIVTLYMLLLIRMLQGIGWAATITSTSTIVVGIIPPKRRSEGIGYFSMAMPLAMIIGPALSVELHEYFTNFNVVFAISTGSGCIALILSLLLNIPYEQKPKKKLVLSFRELYESRVYGIAFMQFCYSFVYSGLVTFIPIYVNNYEIGKVSYYFIAYAVSVIVSRFLVRKTFDLHGPNMLLLSGFIFFALGMICIAFAETNTGLLFGGMFAGFGGGILMPVINTMTMNVVEADSRGKANATIFTSIDVGMGLGAIALGHLVELTSHRTTYILSASILLIPLIYFYLFERIRYRDNLKKLESLDQVDYESGNS